MTENNAIKLPSGSTISAETWSWMLEDGTWHGYLDPKMYSQADRDFLDSALSNG